MIDLRKINKSKKAQFYLFTAILLCVSAYGLLSGAPAAKEKNADSEVLASNYFFEAKNVINQALYKESSPSLDADIFTNKFISYAKTKNTDIQIAYLLKNDDKIRAVNYLKNDINIISHNKTIKKSESITLNLTNIITIRYDETDYNYTFTNDTVEFKALIIT